MRRRGWRASHSQSRVFSERGSRSSHRVPRSCIRFPVASTAGTASSRPTEAHFAPTAEDRKGSGHQGLQYTPGKFDTVSPKNCFISCPQELPWRNSIDPRQCFGMCGHRLPSISRKAPSDSHFSSLSCQSSQNQHNSSSKVLSVDFVPNSTPNNLRCPLALATN